MWNCIPRIVKQYKTLIKLLIYTKSLFNVDYYLLLLMKQKICFNSYNNTINFTQKKKKKEEKGKRKKTNK